MMQSHINLAARRHSPSAANDDHDPNWGDEWDELRGVISARAKRRLIAACGDPSVARAGWTDAHVDRFLQLLGAGHRQCDAAAVVNGDALLGDDGRVDYDPGCSWIDAALALNARSGVALR